MGYGKFIPSEDAKDACVIVLIPEYLQEDNFFYTEVIWEIDNETKNRGGCAIHVGVTRDMETMNEPPAIPKGFNIIGTLMVGIFDPEYASMLSRLYKPIFAVDISYDGIPHIGSSNFNGGYAATKALTGRGHTEIGFIGPVYTAVSVYERWCGYNMAMYESKLSFDKNYNIIGEKGFQLFDSKETLQPYIDRLKKFPTAWFCAGDRIAIEMIHLLAKMNIKVPDDISIIGFDDILAAQMVLPQLTTVKTDRKLMGRLAVDCVYSIGKNDDLAQCSRIIPYEIVWRDSVKNITE